PTAGLSSPQITACPRNGSTRCLSPSRDSTCSLCRLARPPRRRADGRAAAQVLAAPTVAPITPVTRWKRELDAGRRAIEAAFRSHRQPRRLLAAQTLLTDRVLRGLWAEIDPTPETALVAVGGYGRGALFPESDVDVLVLLSKPLAEMPPAASTAFERFVSPMWDIGLEIGHSVRTIEECEKEMNGDAVVRTSLLERRLLAGSRTVYLRFERRFSATLDVRGFFEAKMLEQQQRHLRHQDAVYNLEPNLKESPGGIRDLQTILWIARAAGLGHTWRG